MEPIRVVQTGDFHLDRPFTSGQLTPAQSRQRRRDLRETFSAVMDLASQRGADLLLVTGDLFEHTGVSWSTIRFLREEWALRPNLKVLVTPGNHDPAVSDSYYHTVDWSPNVHIFRQGKMERVQFPELNLDVHGFGWTTWEVKQSCLEGYRISDQSRYNLLVFHGEIEGRDTSSYCPVSRQEIAAAGFNTAAVGHIHQQQQFQWKGRMLARYAGSPEPLDFGEPGSHGVYWGELSLDGDRWEFIPISQREYKTVHLEPDCLLSSRSLESCLAEKNEDLHERRLLRIEVNGPRVVDDGYDIEELNYWLASQCFYGEIHDRTYPDYDLDALESEYEDTVLADFIEEMKIRIEQANPDGLPRLYKALQYGLDALTGKRGGLR